MADLSEPLAPVALSLDALAALEAAAGADNIITSGASLENLSRDYYWYSPLLKEKLSACRAGAIAKVRDLDALRRVVSAAVRHRLPVTVRGAGTGNYGQCIPLYGGLVIDLSGFNRILDLSADGVVTTEPGAKLITIENEARKKGFELRCYPSTFFTATVGGFIGGGSGGIGSISWGGLRDLGTVKRLRLLTAEEEPREIVLEEKDTMKAFHAYGTNGIITELQLRLAPAYPWDQIIVVGPRFEAVVDFADAVARDDAIRKRLVTGFQGPICNWFTPFRKYLPDDTSATFLEVESSQAAEVAARAAAAGLTVTHTIAHHEPRRPPMLSDFTWNHTTLWALKSDPTLTYLQAGFQSHFRAQMAQLEARFPGELLMHLEWVRGNSKMGAFGEVMVGSLPIVRYRNAARLREIIAYCGEIGVFIANPHTPFIEEGGRDFGFEVQRALKREADPHGLLNPGKMKTYPHNPFAQPAA